MQDFTAPPSSATLRTSATHTHSVGATAPGSRRVCVVAPCRMRIAMPPPLKRKKSNSFMLSSGSPLDTETACEVSKHATYPRSGGCAISAASTLARHRASGIGLSAKVSGTVSCGTRTKSCRQRSGKS